MKLSRREFLAGTAGLAGLQLLYPVVLRIGGAATAAPVRRRLVVVFLQGGNDGLNTVVPAGDVGGAPRYSVYRKVRPTLAYAPEALLPLDRPGDADHSLGLNPKLSTVHRLYRQNRVALVQGVDYPNHNYSHFVSTDIWQSGEPGRAPDSGWVGRHLDRVGTAADGLRAVGVGGDVPLALRGKKSSGAAIRTIATTRFADHSSAAAAARHAAFARFAEHARSEALRHHVGAVARQTVEVVKRLSAVPSPPATGLPIADALMTARTLLVHDLGVECVFVSHPGYDTHANQRAAHERLLSDLDAGIEAFFDGTVRGKPLGVGPLPDQIATETMVVTFSEFGRRIGENGGASASGTDHGAAGPMLLITGAPATPLVAGIHGEHPELGSPTLPADNLMMTTDVRSVYGAILDHWLADPDPLYRRGQSLPGLFN